MGRGQGVGGGGGVGVMGAGSLREVGEETAELRRVTQGAGTVWEK